MSPFRLRKNLKLDSVDLKMLFYIYNTNASMASTAKAENVDSPLLLCVRFKAALYLYMVAALVLYMATNKGGTVWHSVVMQIKLPGLI
jgi:hypothetical protein